jgi:hypothetical protein
MKKLFLIAALMASSIFAQTVTPPAPATVLPTSVSVFGQFNQDQTPKVSAGLSAYYSTVQQSTIGMYNTSTVDIIPVRVVDPATGKSIVVLNTSVRQGLCEKLFSTTKFFLGTGLDVGPGFSSNGQNVNVNLNSSFNVTAIYKLTPVWSVISPNRLLYIPGAGFNPVIALGVNIDLSALNKNTSSKW